MYFRVKPTLFTVVVVEFLYIGVSIYPLSLVKLKSNDKKNSFVVSRLVVTSLVVTVSTTIAGVPSMPVPVPLSNVRFWSTIS